MSDEVSGRTIAGAAARTDAVTARRPWAGTASSDADRQECGGSTPTGASSATLRTACWDCAAAWIGVSSSRPSTQLSSSAVPRLACISVGRHGPATRSGFRVVLRYCLASAQSVLERVRGSCRPGLHVDLGEDIAQVSRNGLLAQRQCARDLCVALAGGDQAEHFDLPVGQPVRAPLPASERGERSATWRGPRAVSALTIR
jgi:hypothetical protein